MTNERGMTHESVIDVRGDRTSAPARIAAVAGTLASVFALVGGFLWLAIPDLNPFVPNLYDAPLLDWAGPSGAALALLVTGAGGAGFGGLVLFRRVTLSVASALIALILSCVTGFGLLGSGSIVMSGYLFAFALPIGLVVLIVAWARRRPVPAVLAGVALIAAVAVGEATRTAPLVTLYSEIGQTLVARWAQFSTTTVVIVMAAAWALWVFALASTRRSSAFARWVLRWRPTITIAAAVCALPYPAARATWLTPWPQYGGSNDAFADYPEMRILGLMLGTAVLTGGILTLGLILRWGERFPRWIPGVAGRPVPVALAAVPGAIAAILFTFGGPSLAAITGGNGATGIDSFLGTLILPFWLWGPLLALAVWGYVLHRRAA